MRTLWGLAKYAFWIVVIVWLCMWLLGDRVPLPGYSSGGGFPR
jgi:hypothetical protein